MENPLDSHGNLTNILSSVQQGSIVTSTEITNKSLIKNYKLIDQKLVKGSLHYPLNYYEDCCVNSSLVSNNIIVKTIPFDYPDPTLIPNHLTLLPTKKHYMNVKTKGEKTTTKNNIINKLEI